MENTEGKVLKENLFNTKKVGWENVNEDEKNTIFKYADEYMYYLNNSKTEKEIVQTSKDILIKNGFVDLSEKNELHTGDKVYFINRNRNVFAAVIGEEPIEKGMKITAKYDISKEKLNKWKFQKKN